MKQLFTTLLLLSGICAVAEADVWKWVDAEGKTHYVNTMTPIYTWVDEFGKAHYSDTPDHEDAVSVQLVWHSSGTLDAVADDAGKNEIGDDTYASGSPEDDAEQAAAQEYYCKRATEVYDSYTNAPQLYTTNDAGERVILSEQEVAKTIADTKARMARYCG